MTVFTGRDARACQGDSGAWAGGRGLEVTSGARARQPVVVEDGVGGVGGSVHKTVVAKFILFQHAGAKIGLWHSLACSCEM